MEIIQNSNIHYDMNLLTLFIFHMIWLLAKPIQILRVFLVESLCMTFWESLGIFSPAYSMPPLWDWTLYHPQFGHNILYNMKSQKFMLAQYNTIVSLGVKKGNVWQRDTWGSHSVHVFCLQTQNIPSLACLRKVFDGGDPHTWMVKCWRSRLRWLKNPLWTFFSVHNERWRWNLSPPHLNQGFWWFQHVSRNERIEHILRACLVNQQPPGWFLSNPLLCLLSKQIRMANKRS